MGHTEPTEPGAVDATTVTVGIGVRPGTGAQRIVRAVESVVGGATIACLATLDSRAGEAGVRAAAAALGVRVVAFTAGQLAGVEVAHSSDRTAAAVGTPSVAEAAARLAGGGELVCGRTIVDGIVVVAAQAPADRSSPESTGRKSPESNRWARSAAGSNVVSNSCGADRI